MNKGTEKETLNYEIKTEGFEKILLAMQHITQRIKKGEKCVATIEYDPDALFTKITTVIEQSKMEADLEIVHQSDFLQSNGHQ